MRSLIVVIAGAIAGLFLIAGSGLAQPASLPVQAFAQLPQFALATLSPSGNKVAFFNASNGQRIVTAYDLDAGTAERVNVGDFVPERLIWADEDTLIIVATSIEYLRGVLDTAEQRLSFSVDLTDGARTRRMLRDARGLGPSFDAGAVVGIQADTAHVLINTRMEDFDRDLIAADPRRSRIRTVAYGSEDTIEWVIDGSGTPVARIDYSNDLNRQRLLVQEDGFWVPIREETEVDIPVYNAAGLLADGRLALQAKLDTGDDDTRTGLYAVSLETGAIEDEIFLHDRYDLAYAVIDPYSRLVVGAAYHGEALEIDWFDDAMAARQSSLNDVFPDFSVSILSWSQDRSQMLIGVSGEAAPIEYYLYNAQTNNMSRIAYSAETLTGQLDPRVHITFQASDGATIPGYLTLPAGDGPHPTVVLPHGGPASRDVGGYDYWAHFLASRGYLVIQPNFRGSTGYGDNWQEAGDGGWGRGVMQQDLTDALNALVEGGYADPDRICIVGGSYGGYAALAGATFTPDLYACAASIAGVSAVGSMIDYSRSQYGRDHWVVSYWRDNILEGETSDANSRLRDISPLYHAEAVQSPVLLMHGNEDLVVPIEQSERMASALRRAGKDVRFVRLDGGDHQLSREETRLAVLSELEAFLAEHIGD